MGITDGYCFGDKGKFELHFVWLQILGIYKALQLFPYLEALAKKTAESRIWFLPQAFFITT
jgi:hypothetical protein